MILTNASVNSASKQATFVASGANALAARIVLGPKNSLINEEG